MVSAVLATTKICLKDSSVGAQMRQKWQGTSVVGDSSLLSLSVMVSYFVFSFFLALSLSWSSLSMSLSFSWAMSGQDRELDCLGARKAMTRKPEALKGKTA